MHASKPGLRLVRCRGFEVAGIVLLMPFIPTLGMAVGASAVIASEGIMSADSERIQFIPRVKKLSSSLLRCKIK